MALSSYRGRLAPSPTGYLHLGHARTFWIAFERAQRNNGTLIFRSEDLDISRCRPEFETAQIEDLRWLGISWQEGPDCGGSFGPYCQRQRLAFYQSLLRTLLERGFIYPCVCSRQDVMRALGAPHAGEEEPLYPGTCRNNFSPDKALDSLPPFGSSRGSMRINWRFRVPDGQTISFVDGLQGQQSYMAGKDFGDFVVWRHDNTPAYQLAVVADDAAMKITEVVRGMDLLKSTARQLLLYHALDFAPPAFYHCPLVTDDHGVRLAKRHDALSLRSMRLAGQSPESLRKNWGS